MNLLREELNEVGEMRRGNGIRGNHPLCVRVNKRQLFIKLSSIHLVV